MSKDLFPQERIKYVWDRYFPELTATKFYSEIAKASEIDGKRVSNNTIKNWLDGKTESTVRLDSAVRGAADCFARLATKNQSVTSDKLGNFFRFGLPTPFSIFSGHQETFGKQLTFEHLLPFITLEDAASLAAPDFRNRDPEVLASWDQMARASKFLRGGAPNDWAVLNHVAIPRPEEARILAALDVTQLVILTGPAGDGKTTILKRLALNLRQQNQEVFFVEAPVAGLPFPVPPSFDRPTHLLIDGAHLAASYNALVESLMDNPNLHVVLSARHYEWQKRDFRFPTLRPATVDVRQIDDSQAQALARRILAFKANSVSSTDVELVQAILSSVRGKSYPHLLAAMMTATRRESFEHILDDIIRSFGDGGDEWALRYVACGALTHEMSAGQVELLPHYLFERLISNRIESPFGGRAARERIFKKLEEFSSEILPIRMEPLARQTVYDLRHPDFVYRVVEKCYGGLWGKQIQKLDLLQSDFDDIFAADRMAAIDQQSMISLDRRYGPRAALAWLGSPPEFRWLAGPLGTELMSSVIGSFGTYHAEKNSKALLLAAWADWEAKKPAGELDNELIDKLFLEAASAAPQETGIWKKWADLKVKRGDIGEWPNPSPSSARGIYFRASEQNVASNLVHHWAVLEWAHGNIGTRTDSERYSARWLFKQALPDGLLNQEFAMLWSKLEDQAEHDDGTVAKELLDPETARQLPEIYSARWILQQSIKTGGAHVALVNFWAKLEVERKNFGDFHSPLPRSARWLFRYGLGWSGKLDESGEEHFDDAVLTDQEFVRSWTEMETEAQGEIGEWPKSPADDSNPVRFSIRWVLNEAWQKTHAIFMLLLLVRFEEEHGNLGDVSSPNQYSARGLLRHALHRPRVDRRQVFNLWILLEIRNAKYQGEDSLRLARDLLRERKKIPERYFEALLFEGKIREAEGNIGSFDNPSLDSARALYRKLLEEYNFTARSWTILEKDAEDRSRNRGKKYSFEWIFEQYKMRGGREENWFKWLTEPDADENHRADPNSL